MLTQINAEARDVHEHKKLWSLKINGIDIDIHSDKNDFRAGAAK